MSDEFILQGFKDGDALTIRKYFYGYCEVGYNIFDQRYQLRGKENLDFMSLAHQYALYLMEHNWKPLEDRSPNVSLRTWVINGFRFVVLDALKWYKKEYGSITFEDYLQSFNLDGDLRLQFNRVVEGMCLNVSMPRQDRLIIDMMLLKGFKGNEIAAEMGMTPSAVSQRYKKLMREVITPYFKKNFDMELEAPEVLDVSRAMYDREPTRVVDAMPSCMPDMTDRASMAEDYDMDIATILFGITPKLTQDTMSKRTTPEFISELEPNEIFVFGSNLKGLHGGGAAYTAYRKFGAIMGQGVGLQGQSYGIPTMQGGVETIRPYVDEFINFAKQHQELTFLVTRVGCGIAGFDDEEISPLFEKAHSLDNVVLPEGW